MVVLRHLTGGADGHHVLRLVLMLLMLVLVVLRRLLVLMLVLLKLLMVHMLEVLRVIARRQLMPVGRPVIGAICGEDGKETLGGLGAADFAFSQRLSPELMSVLTAMSLITGGEGANECSSAVGSGPPGPVGGTAPGGCFRRRRR